MVIATAGEPDLAAVRRLLEGARLPLDRLDEHVGTMVVARDGGEVVGAAAVELYADGALLRSVVVHPSHQGRGLGRRLTEAALDIARQRGSHAAFLLTTTAEAYFPKLGFVPIARADIPSSVQSSVEFQSACPASAAALYRRLSATVLFACVHNAGRSQMAAAWFNRLADESRARAISAGTDPGTRVHPEVVTVMREVGVDLADAATTRLTPELARRAQVLVTMGCGDQCPHVPGARTEDWPLDDPKGQSLAEVRRIRDDIRDRVQALVGREGWARATG